MGWGLWGLAVPPLRPVFTAHHVCPVLSWAILFTLQSLGFANPNVEPVACLPSSLGGDGRVRTGALPVTSPLGSAQCTSPVLALVVTRPLSAGQGELGPLPHS